MAQGLKVAVVGAGWAGLASAVELADRGARVSVLESARQPGGRARTVNLEGLELDNGPHLLIGAYRATLGLMSRLGSDNCLQRRPLQLASPPRFCLQLPRLPAPLHLAVGLLRARGLDFKDKLAAARFMGQLKAGHFRLERDMSVTQLLDRHRQSPRLKRYLWEPLCLAALTTPPEKASAQVFAHVLRDSLAGPRAASDFVLPVAPLGSLIPKPATAWLAENGHRVRLSCRVTRIRPTDGSFQVEWSNDSGLHREDFDQVIIATAPQHARKLLPEDPALTSLGQMLGALDFEPINTVYLAYPREVGLPFPLLALPGPVGQWVFDRGALGGQPGLLACILSAHGPWEALSATALAKALHQELGTALGRPLPPPLWQRSIREARATFACTPDLRRPPNATALKGLWLAGDYTAGDYPATLEGAVASGQAAARALLKAAG